MNMSEQLRQARMGAGITVTQLANSSGVSRTTIEKSEREEAIRYVYAARIVRALNELAGTQYTVESLGIVTTQ